MDKKIKFELFIKYVLIILTLISISITYLNFTYLTYQDLNIEIINDFLITYINNCFLWLDNILLFIFAVLYIIVGIKSKKEVLLKVLFSIFSILTTMLASTFIINVIAGIFKII